MTSLCLTATPSALADGGSEMMYDASVTNISHIPSNAQLVAGGDAWTQADFNEFPNAEHVTISCTSNDYSKLVVDFESKCVFTKAALVSWIQNHQALGEGPGTVYTWYGNISTVESDLQGYNYYLWVADQTGVEHSYNGPSNEIATQWCGYGGSGLCPGNSFVDESLVTNPAALSGQTVPVLRGVTAWNSGSSNSTATITVNLPVGYQPGDMLIIWLVWNGTGTSPTLSGWTSYTKVTGTIGVKMFTRVATGTEGSSVSVNFASGFVYSGLCADYENVNLAAPLDPVPPNSGQINAASTTITVPGVTTSRSDDELVWFGATTGPSGSAPGTITVPTGFTAEVSQDNSASTSARNSGTILADQLEAAPGATGNRNGASSTSVINAGMLVALAAG
jgi:hypothetical protein